MKKCLCMLLVTLLMLFSVTAVADHPFDGMLYYEDSTYCVGIDMQPGEYVLVSSSVSHDVLPALADISAYLPMPIRKISSSTASSIPTPSSPWSGASM